MALNEGADHLAKPGDARMPTSVGSVDLSEFAGCNGFGFTTKPTTSDEIKVLKVPTSAQDLTIRWTNRFLPTCGISRVASRH